MMATDPARRPRAVSEDDVTGVKGHMLVDKGDHVGGGEGDGEDSRLHGAHQADLCSGKDRGQIIIIIVHFFFPASCKLGLYMSVYFIEILVIYSDYNCFHDLQAKHFEAHCLK